MAGRLVTEEEIRGLVVAADGARPLGFVYFCDSEEEPTWRATAFVVRVRRGGFFAALPRDDRVQDGLQQLCEGEEDTVFFSESVIAGETPRRRPVGLVEIFLADVPWRFLPFFRKAVAGRGSGPELIPISQDGTTVRPVKAAL